MFAQQNVAHCILLHQRATVSRQKHRNRICPQQSTRSEVGAHTKQLLPPRAHPGSGKINVLDHLVQRDMRVVARGSR